MFSSLINTSVVGLALVAAVNGAGPDISGVGINSYTHGGSACPQGSTDFAINVDATSITTRYSAFGFSSGSSTFARKNCQINLDIKYPAGLQYAVTDVTFVDNLNIGTGVLARHSSTYYFSGSAAQNSIVHEYNGPVQGEYTYKETVPASSQIWSPCGAPLPLNINNGVALRKPGGGDAYFNGKTVVTGIVWRNC